MGVFCPQFREEGSEEKPPEEESSAGGGDQYVYLSGLVSGRSFFKAEDREDAPSQVEIEEQAAGQGLLKKAAGFKAQEMA